MLLSIIVPVYNVEKYLSRCLDSLIEQDINKSEYEIILVNDGSTDSSPIIAENYAQKHRHIKLVNQENKGLSEARNTGIKNSSGTYLFFIDSDDYIETYVLNGLLEQSLLKNLDFLGFDYTNTSSSNFKLGISSKNIFDINHSIQVFDGYSFIAQHNFYNNACWYLFKKEIIIKNNIEFVSGIMVEDGIFTAELLLNCQRVAYIPLSIYRYFDNLNSIMRNTSEAHVNRLNNDFKIVINKYAKLIDLALSKDTDKKSITRLKARQQSYVFFLFVRLIKANVGFTQINKLTEELKLINVYPLREFIGVDYNSVQEKILTLIFNYKISLFMLISLNKPFKFIK